MRCSVPCTHFRVRRIGGMACDWELPACFSDDPLFAVDEAREQRTFCWLINLREQQTTWSDVKRQIEECLRQRDAGVLRILDQIDCAAVLSKPWLRAPANDKHSG